ncbi:MAG: toll/interleukin-1 receptor domain-containing protein [candidate division KSB1 bacterium]|nr:toll/interleukin-1 receptor domain-containing protein [candidate division KSB1 bacterium]
MPKAFISHSWEDNETSRKLAEYLRHDGAEIWIDYAHISGDDSLPEVIGQAIK